MSLEQDNREVCLRMAAYVTTKPLAERELRIGSDYSDAARADSDSMRPGWFATKRDMIEQQVKGNVLAIIRAAGDTATMLGVPAPQLMQKFLRSDAPVGSEAWRRSAVRRHLLRHALGAALRNQPGH